MKQTGRKYRVKQASLTGGWTGNGGWYYLRQVGSRLWWAGISSSDLGASYTNVFRGTINRDTGIIEGDWVDVPRGRNSGRGRLRLEIVAQNELRVIAQTGGFGVTRLRLDFNGFLNRTNKGKRTQ